MPPRITTSKRGSGCGATRVARCEQHATISPGRPFGPIASGDYKWTGCWDSGTDAAGDRDAGLEPPGSPRRQFPVVSRIDCREAGADASRRLRRQRSSQRSNGENEGETEKTQPAGVTARSAVSDEGARRAQVGGGVGHLRPSRPLATRAPAAAGVTPHPPSRTTSSSPFVLRWLRFSVVNSALSVPSVPGAQASVPDRTPWAPVP